MKRLFIAAVVISCCSIPTGVFAQKVGGGDLTFTPKNASPVIFSHEKHVVEHGMKCTGCHYQIFQMNKGSYKMDMARITKGEFCGRCHNGQKAFDVRETKNCNHCHR